MSHLYLGCLELCTSKGWVLKLRVFMSLFYFFLSAPSTPELQQRPKQVSPKSQRKNHSLQSLGCSLVCSWHGLVNSVVFLFISFFNSYTDCLDTYTCQAIFIKVYWILFRTCTCHCYFELQPIWLFDLWWCSLATLSQK